MFLPNKFARWYLALCSTRQAMRGSDRARGFDCHHIIPRALGGSNEPGNLVRLTYREHFIAHRLLCRALADLDARKRMNSVVVFFSERAQICPAAREYERRRMAREGKPRDHGAKISAATKGKPKPWLKGRKRPEHAAAMTGRKSPEHSARMKGRKFPGRGVGRRLSVEHIETLRLAASQPKPVLQCPYCSKEGRGHSNMKRWHFDNCPAAGGTRPNFAGRAQSPERTCTHCGTVGRRNMSRFHFENCRHRA